MTATFDSQSLGRPLVIASASTAGCSGCLASDRSDSDGQKPTAQRLSCGNEIDDADPAVGMHPGPADIETRRGQSHGGVTDVPQMTGFRHESVAGHRHQVRWYLVP